MGTRITYYNLAKDRLKGRHPRIYNLILIFILLLLTGVAAKVGEGRIQPQDIRLVLIDQAVDKRTERIAARSGVGIIVDALVDLGQLLW